jgi:tRNA-binding EMAP/Myf-like protein
LSIITKRQYQRLGFHQLKRAEYNEVQNVTRWYDHIQYLIRDELGAGKLERLVIDLDPLAPVEKVKDAKDAAEPKEKAKKTNDNNNNSNNNNKKSDNNNNNNKSDNNATDKKKPAETMDKTASAMELFPLLDLRIGLVTAVSKHPTADKLYVEQIDVGEGGKFKEELLF